MVKKEILTEQPLLTEIHCGFFFEEEEKRQMGDNV
jgi:hypothetical protein